MFYLQWKFSFTDNLLYFTDNVFIIINICFIKHILWWSHISWRKLYKNYLTNEILKYNSNCSILYAVHSMLFTHHASAWMCCERKCALLSISIQFHAFCIWNLPLWFILIYQGYIQDISGIYISCISALNKRDSTICCFKS